jgi:hypothetical protein
MGAVDSAGADSTAAAEDAAEEAAFSVELLHAASPSAATSATAANETTFMWEAPSLDLMIIFKVTQLLLVRTSGPSRSQRDIKHSRVRSPQTG